MGPEMLLHFEQPVMKNPVAGREGPKKLKPGRGGSGKKERKKRQKYSYAVHPKDGLDESMCHLSPFFTPSS